MKKEKPLTPEQIKQLTKVTVKDVEKAIVTAPSNLKEFLNAEKE